MIIIEDLKIILYEPSHLLKCIRNNLSTKDCKYVLVDGITKWSNVLQTYHIDKSKGSDGFLDKIKDSHVRPGKIKKIRIRYYMQVFSNTEAKMMKLYSKQEMESRYKTRKMFHYGIQTANFLQFFNDLFDTLIGGINMRDQIMNNKTIINVLDINTEQEQMWNSALKLLNY